ncbi:MAG: hypothetical protein M3Z96_09045 [Pseudomonadota bacterium]|nr:hypothetical protein [Pseudomonadota bacterium]
MTKQMVKKAPGKTFTVGVRFTEAERIGLVKCAESDDRPVSVMLHKIVYEYLREEGFLPDRRAATFIAEGKALKRKTGESKK